MLTIQSNLKIQDLETLSKTLVKPDIINFGLNKVGGGYTDKIADKVIAKLSKLDKDKTIVIINDITLQMADKLLEAGYKNIYLAFGSFNKDGTVSKDKTVYNIMKAVIENNIKEKLNVITLEEIFNMKIKFDGIIANPPYNKIGARITKAIIDSNIDYQEYINLLPANDYRRWNDIYRYQTDMETIINGFNDTAVITHLARIHKTPINNISANDFEINQYLDRTLDKYFLDNFKRTHYAISNYDSGYHPENWELDKTFILGSRDIAAKHLTGNSKPYKWNVERSIDKQYIIDNCNIPVYARQNKFRASFFAVVFKTTDERTNFTNFCYSKLGYKFISKIFTAVNANHMGDIDKLFPKVDWTRSWTVEEILADYGYTEDEIKEVMEDLKNFKGMDD